MGIWKDAAYADRLEREAADLKRRFNRDFWVEDGEYFALALDTEGRQVDALASNNGHLLWSGIVDKSKAKAVARHLVGPRLFSGWGVRTLAEGEARYNPLGYHVGTVWPFDNSFIAWGLRRYGFKEEAGRIAAGNLDAAEFFGGRLPEAFGGYERSKTNYPVEYPTACSPQAWSAGAPLLFLRTMLGLEPSGDHLIVDPAIPEGIGRVELLDIRGRWGRIDAFGRERVPIEKTDGRATPMTETWRRWLRAGERVNVAAASADGRNIAFEAPLGTPLEPGGFAVVETTPPLLAQVTACELGVRDVDGRRAHVLEGTATALGDGRGGFSDLPIAKAPPEAVAAWAAERLDPEGLHLGALVDAPATHALLDARGLARHTFLCGQSGSGKTYTTGVLLEQVLRQTRLRLIVLDPNSDHVGLREAREDADPAVAGAAPRARRCAARRTGERGTAVRDRLDRPALLQLQRCGPGADPPPRPDRRLRRARGAARCHRPGCRRRTNRPRSPPRRASWTRRQARRLASRIRALGIADWHLWQRDPAQRVLGDLARTGEGIVIDTGSMADPAERSAIAAAVLNGIWEQRRARVPTLVVLDEAHHICPAEPLDPIQAVATEHAVLIAGEGRKYGIFLLVATQRPQKVHPSVVAGCESLVLLRMNSLRDVRELEAAFSHIRRACCVWRPASCAARRSWEAPSPRRRCTCASGAGSPPRAAATCRPRGRVHRS